MPGVKRGSEELLPFTRPAKVARTSVRRPDGGNASPSQDAPLRARWFELGLESAYLMADTLKAVFGFAKAKLNGQQGESPSVPVSVDSLPTDEESAPAQAYLATPPPSVRPSPQPQLAQPPQSQPPPQPVAGPSRSRLNVATHPLPRPQRQQQPQPQQPLGRQRSDAETSTSSAATSQQRRSHEAARTVTGLPSPPPSRTTSSSSTSFLDSYPDVAEKLDEARAVEENVALQKRKQQVKHRKHIFDKQFKREVKADRMKSRDEMERELYELRRQQGYRANLDEFSGWLAYKERVENLDRLPVSPSMVDVSKLNALTPANRRHSMPQLTPASPEFLRRALRDAKISLASPKPPPPFIPSLDLLRQAARDKDEEIESRLRKPKPLPTDLPPEVDAEVDALLRKRGVIAKCGRESVADKDISRLLPGQWLNDEIINFYGALIVKRAQDWEKENADPSAPGAATGRPLKAHYFSTFFWPKVCSSDYKQGKLDRWTKKVDLFAKDVVLIPINHGNTHWTSAVINMRKQRIELYDSMGGARPEVYKRLIKYLEEEYKDKKGQERSFASWPLHTLQDTPLQENGYDCGVFTCHFLEALSRGAETFAFTQGDMPYLRRRMIWEIGHAKLRDGPYA